MLPLPDQLALPGLLGLLQLHYPQTLNILSPQGVAVAAIVTVVVAGLVVF
jgi:hypothetical protein